MKSKVLKIVHYGTVELGDEVKISDPCYGTVVWCSGECENIEAGIWDCYIAMTEDCSNPAYLVMCKDGYQFDIPKEIEMASIGVDSGTCGVYDLDYYEKYHSERDVDEDWYHRNVMSWCMKDRAFICEEGMGFVSNTGYGDGCYYFLTERNTKGRVVRMAIDYDICKVDRRRCKFEYEFEEK